MKCVASIRKKYEIIRGDARKLIICEEKLRKTSVSSYENRRPVVLASVCSLDRSIGTF